MSLPRIALITGSSRGIGRAIAVALANAGADITLNYKARGAEAREHKCQNDEGKAPHVS